MLTNWPEMERIGGQYHPISNQPNFFPVSFNFKLLFKELKEVGFGVVTAISSLEFGDHSFLLAGLVKIPLNKEILLLILGHGNSSPLVTSTVFSLKIATNSFPTDCSAST
jgi:hypothetical protein